MPSFGEKLRQEREKRDISLEQISVSTKITTRMLQALEEDKFNLLPGGIFNKGFVRSYARAVGIDEDKAVADYLQASGDAPPVSTEIVDREDGIRENAQKISRLEALADHPPRQLPWGLFAAILLVIALAFAFWKRLPKETSGSAKVARAAVSPAVPLPVNKSDPSSPTANPGKAPPPQAPTVAASPSPAIAPSGDFEVVVHAREQTWLSTRIDAGARSSEVLWPGSERSFRAHRRVSMRVGNAGGVTVTLNGKNVDISGANGKVRTVTFGPQGLSTNGPEADSQP